MQKYSTHLWILTFALGWVFDLLFWQKEPGISFPLFVTLTLAGGMFLLWRGEVRPARQAWFLLLPIAFFSLFTFLRLEPLTVFLGYLLTLFLMGVLALAYQTGRWTLYSLLDYFVGYFRLFISLVAEPLIFQAQVGKARVAEGGEQKRPSAFWPVVRGLLFAVPVLAFFTALLSSADIVFAQRIDELVKLFSLEKLPEYIFRLVYISILAYALAGIFLHAAKPGQDEKLIGLEKPLITSFLGFTEAAIVLGSVVLLFLSFVIIQVQYLFGGLENIRLDGYTYAEYARRGFGELVAVAFFSLLLFLGLSAISRREEGNQRHIFSGLGIFLVALVGVMLISAFQRLYLYEVAYGFTRLRAYTHVFIIWLGILLLATIVLELRSRQRAFALTALLVSLGFAASLTLMNVDGFIVRQNVARHVQGNPLDVGYLASLSPDAVPVLAGFYQSETLDASTRDMVGAALACFNRQAESRQSGEETPAPWQSFHLSRYRADQSLAALNLGDYQFDDESYSGAVTTPQGEEYSCYSNWVD